MTKKKTSAKRAPKLKVPTEVIFNCQISARDKIHFTRHDNGVIVNMLDNRRITQTVILSLSDFNDLMFLGGLWYGK